MRKPEANEQTGQAGKNREHTKQPKQRWPQQATHHNGTDQCYHIYNNLADQAPGKAGNRFLLKVLRVFQNEMSGVTTILCVASLRVLALTEIDFVV